MLVSHSCPVIGPTIKYKYIYDETSQLHMYSGRGEFETPSKAPVISLSEKLYPHSLVLVGPRNEVKHDFTCCHFLEL